MTAPQTKRVRLKDISADPEIQPRVRIDQDVVAEYAEAMAAGQEFPPPDVFFDGKVYRLASGFHRFFAAKAAKLKDLPCNVHEGGEDDAKWFAVATNTTHGLRRTNADKRRAVEIALKLRTEWSDRKIADHVGVSHNFVGDVRRSLSSDDSQPTVREGRDGRRTDTANIGGTSTQPPSQADIEAALKRSPHDSDAKIAFLLKCRPGEVEAVRLQLAAREDAGGGEDGVDDEPADDQDGPDENDEPASNKPATEAGPDILLDGLGAPVPAKMVEAWRELHELAAAEIKTLRASAKRLVELGSKPLAQVWDSALTHELKGKIEDDEEVETKRSVGKIRELIYLLKQSMPFAAVCPYCVNTLDSLSHPSCTACHGWGYVTRRVWRNCDPEYRAVACRAVNGKDPEVTK